MAKNGQDRDAIARIVAPMGGEEIAMLNFYIGLLGRVDDPDAASLFRRMIIESANHLRLDTEMMVKLAPAPAKTAPTNAELWLLDQALEKAEEHEKRAYDMYDRALPKLDDPYLKQTARSIRDEEAKHLEMVKKLREMVKKRMGKG